MVSHSFSDSSTDQNMDQQIATDQEEKVWINKSKARSTDQDLDLQIKSQINKSEYMTTDQKSNKQIKSQINRSKLLKSQINWSVSNQGTNRAKVILTDQQIKDQIKRSKFRSTDQLKNRKTSTTWSHEAACIPLVLLINQKLIRKDINLKKQLI